MSNDNYAELVQFHSESGIMEVDFSDLTFDDSQKVDQVYDAIEKRIEATGQDKWYFLVNYKNCRIFEFAWIRFAQRGKRINIAHSLGSVRFAVRDDLGKTIEASAKNQQFDPNLFASRDDAVAEIERIKQAQSL